MRLMIASICLVLAAACTSAPSGGEAGTEPQVGTPAPSPSETVTDTDTDEAALPMQTRVLSAVDAVRLKQNSGITLQWIGWENRGDAAISADTFGTYRLYGRQTGPEGELLIVLGKITEIGDGYFILDGIIQIANAPDDGRECHANKEWRFAVTQGRKYYRLREFEWCDGLTDYIDIYF